MIYRELSREEIEKLVEIDRSELVEFNYRFVNGSLELVEYYCEIEGFSQSKLLELKSGLYNLYDHRGIIFGAINDNKLVGIASLSNKFRGTTMNRVQLALLHVSKDYRGRGIGRQLVELVKEKATDWGAKQIYVSAAPIKNTVDFYRRIGCKLTSELEEDLFNLEPEDIHMELNI